MRRKGVGAMARGSGHTSCPKRVGTSGGTLLGDPLREGWNPPTALGAAEPNEVWSSIAPMSKAHRCSSKPELCEAAFGSPNNGRALLGASGTLSRSPPGSARRRTSRELPRTEEACASENPRFAQGDESCSQCVPTRDSAPGGARKLGAAGPHGGRRSAIRRERAASPIEESAVASRTCL